MKIKTYSLKASGKVAEYTKEKVTNLKFLAKLVL